jgi:hypothetical protein
MMRRLVLMSVAAFLAAPRPAARACSIAGPTPHVIDASMQATDHVSPVLQTARAEVTRGQTDQGGCLGQSGSSCDDIGTVAIHALATDDMTPPERIGYRLLLTSGTPPVGLTIPVEAIEPPQPSNLLTLAWTDSGTARQQPVNFTLQVVAVDLAGNESAPVTVLVHDPYVGECAAIAPGRVGSRQLAWFAGAALLLVARRGSSRVGSKRATRDGRTRIRV